jgi:hypothetical protein
LDTIEPRSLSATEIADYLRDGWVKVDELIAPAAAAVLLERVKGVVSKRSVPQLATGGSASLEVNALSPIFAVCDSPSDDDPVLRAFSRSPALGRAACDLIDARYREFGGSCQSVRLFEDQVLAKQPTRAGGDRTPWHQDSNLQPFDRFGALVIWIALVDIPPERGSLRFLSGSHRVPPLGRVFHRDDGEDLLDEYPALLERFPLSPALHLAAGDATIHDYCTVHAAGQNTTDDVRWSYLAEFFPASALYTGMPSRQTRDLGLVVNEPLSHSRFPVVTAV